MKKGSGIINSVINKLPIELHLPGYQFCGPGTKLEKRLLKGDRGINKLDEACMYHDIAYNNNDLNVRHKADLQLLNMAKKRLQSKDAGKREKVASWIVKNAMKAKLRAGAGVRSFMKIVKTIQNKIKKTKPKDKRTAIRYAYAAAKKLFGNKKGLRLPRCIPVPKCGGILPLIPIFAGLSALGSLAGGAAGIAKAVNDYKVAKKNFEESKRHNKMMEAVALGKGVYIKSHKKGAGLYLNPSKN
jgi:hypothetical protein